MKRIGIVAVMSLALVAIAAPTVSAHDRYGWGWGHRHHHQDPVFMGRASDANQGGVMRIGAAVKNADRRADFSATAVVHFANDVDVVLQVPGRHHRGHARGHARGRWLFAFARVPVAADEPPGDVLVDITIMYKGQEHKLTVMGHVNGDAADPPPTGEDPPPPPPIES